ncbi:MAG TPA: thioesterase family protein [Balneolaceae bacterium]|nr:thioesterase family protein [Balneolaceae bacterium]
MVNTPDKEPIYSYTYTLRSRYGETDQMGYVYYGRYLDYFEVARTEMIRDLGVSYSKLEEEGFMLPVIYAQISYKSPIYYDEEMNITVLLFRKPRVKLETFYEIRTSRGSAPRASGQVNLCFVDKETRKPCMGPDYFLRLFDHT